MKAIFFFPDSTHGVLALPWVSHNENTVLLSPLSGLVGEECSWEAHSLSLQLLRWECYLERRAPTSLIISLLLHHGLSSEISPRGRSRLWNRDLQYVPTGGDIICSRMSSPDLTVLLKTSKSSGKW